MQVDYNTEMVENIFLRDDQDPKWYGTEKFRDLDPVVAAYLHRLYIAHFNGWVVAAGNDQATMKMNQNYKEDNTVLQKYEFKHKHLNAKLVARIQENGNAALTGKIIDKDRVTAYRLHLHRVGDHAITISTYNRYNHQSQIMMSGADSFSPFLAINTVLPLISARGDSFWSQHAYRYINGEYVLIDPVLIQVGKGQSWIRNYTPRMKLNDYNKQPNMVGLTPDFTGTQILASLGFVGHSLQHPYAEMELPIDANSQNIDFVGSGVNVRYGLGGGLDLVNEKSYSSIAIKATLPLTILDFPPPKDS